MESSRSCLCAREEVVALLGFLNSSQAVGLTAPRFSIFVFVSWYEASAACEHFRRSVFRRFQFGDRNVQFLAAGFVEELQFGLPPRQFDFDFGAARVADFDPGAQIAQNFVRRGQRFAMPRFLFGEFEHGALGRRDLFARAP